MTKDELVERAKRQLNAGQPQPHVWPDAEIDLDACVMQALSEVADMAMRDPYLKALLQQTYSVTLDASGVGDPLTATGSITSVAGEILMEGIDWGAVVDGDGNVLAPIQHYFDFIRPRSTDFAYYCRKDGKIYTRAKGKEVNGPLDIESVNGPLTITASFAPQSVTSIKPELEDMTVHALCRIVTLKLPADANA